MDLARQLADTQAQLERNYLTSQQTATFQQATTDLQQTDLVQRSLPVGATLPDFELPNLAGELVTSQQLLAAGPLVLSFYRGSWCPFCSLELKALEIALPAIAELGATLVSISPELPRRTRQLADEQALRHLLLHDRGNQFAQQLGLTFTLSADVRQTYQELGIALPRFNGDESHKLPVPATFIIATDGTIAYRFVNPDYTKRLDPVEIVTILTRLQQPAA